MVMVANQTRRSFKQQKVYFAFSTRELMNWARLTNELGVKEAAQVAILAKASAEDAAVINDFINMNFE